MTVHALMPVFNRLEMTKNMVTCLKKQVLDEKLTITVIDDGSTDGTSDYLKSLDDVNLLEGNGSLWWAGAIQLGFLDTFKNSKPNDWVLLVNNDTEIGSDFIQSLLNTARKHAPAVVGSVVRETANPHKLLSIGPIINVWQLRIQDAIDIPESHVSKCTIVDALSGRGVLYPLEALRKVRGMRPKILPHYLADYDLSIRVKNCGFKLIISNEAIVFSENNFGNSRKITNFKDKLFSVSSPKYLPAIIGFWAKAATPLQIVALPFLIAILIPARKIINSIVKQNKLNRRI